MRQNCDKRSSASRPYFALAVQYKLALAAKPVQGYLVHTPTPRLTRRRAAEAHGDLWRCRRGHRGIFLAPVHAPMYEAKINLSRVDCESSSLKQRKTKCKLLCLAITLSEREVPSRRKWGSPCPPSPERLCKGSPRPMTGQRRCKSGRTDTDDTQKITESARIHPLGVACDRSRCNRRFVSKTRHLVRI